jgi:hypothetical protein
MRCKTCTFEDAWRRLQRALKRCPRCPEHRKYPCVSTLAQGAVNDIIDVSSEGVEARAHSTDRKRLIRASTFKRWYNHLCEQGSASLVPGHRNNPAGEHSCLVGAIIAACFPGKITVVNNNTIRLV